MMEPEQLPDHDGEPLPPPSKPFDRIWLGVLLGMAITALYYLVLLGGVDHGGGEGEIIGQVLLLAFGGFLQVPVIGFFAAFVFLSGRPRTAGGMMIAAGLAALCNTLWCGA